MNQTEDLTTNNMMYSTNIKLIPVLEILLLVVVIAIVHHIELALYMASTVAMLQ